MSETQHSERIAPDLPPMPLPNRVLLTSPEHFTVEYVINPHMEGNIGEVDRDRALRQWEGLRDTYESLGLNVSVIAGESGLPDMVFCANQTLPYLTPSGEKGVVLSRMHAPQRKPEVEHFGRYFESQGYAVRSLDDDLPGDFEGMGDAIWHPGRFLLWGGYGYRTDATVYDRLAEHFGLTIIPLSLTDPDFYHLDTCFCPLDEETVLIFPPAFDAEGLAAIRSQFKRVVEAPEDEARGLFACNAHCPDGKHVIIQRGCTKTNAALRGLGFEIIEVDTDEYLKSGGSVFCMKVMYW